MLIYSFLLLFFPLFLFSFFPFSVFVSITAPVGTLLGSSMPLEARVKSVLSGDTVVLSHVTNPSQERILSLAYVSAPRLRREGDEVSPFFSMDLPTSDQDHAIDGDLSITLSS